MPRPRARMAAPGASNTASLVAYYRVSTAKQGRSGLGLEAQQAAVAAFSVLPPRQVVAEYREVETGTRDARPQLALALAECRARGSVLIVAKLDRLTRNTAFLLAIVDGVGEGGVVFCDLPQLPAGPIGTYILTMFAAFAQLERGMISQRTKAALAAARARGVKLGSHSLARGFDSKMSRAGRQAQTVRATIHAADVRPFIAAARAAGASSLASIANALTARGIRPPSGGDRWHGNQVRRIERVVAGSAPGAPRHT
jgi:DNA invertase Pin-like site-specific DNA recombinase